jgi:hypothetical protein
MASYEGYCVKCREKREFEGEKKELPNGRFAAQGQCPKCGTKITRMLGKSAWAEEGARGPLPRAVGL